MSEVEVVFTHEFISGDCEEAENEIKSLRTQLTAAQATIAQRDAQVAALQADRDAWRKEREDVANLLYTQEGRLGALTDQLAARDAQVAELTAALVEADDALVSVINYRDAQGVHPLDGPITIAVDRAISRSRELLARTPAAPQDSHNP